MILRALGKVTNDIDLETGEDADEFFHGGPVVDLLANEDVGLKSDEGILRGFHLLILGGLGSIGLAAGEPFHVPIDDPDILRPGERGGKEQADGEEGVTHGEPMWAGKGGESTSHAGGRAICAGRRVKMGLAQAEAKT